MNIIIKLFIVFMECWLQQVCPNFVNITNISLPGGEAINKKDSAHVVLAILTNLWSAGIIVYTADVKNQNRNTQIIHLFTCGALHD